MSLAAAAFFAEQAGPVREIACRECGCTADEACVDTDGEPCRWINFNPPLCSACVAPPRADKAGAAVNDPAAPVDAGFFSAGLCEASAKPALHAPVLLNEGSGYCARCKLGFVL